MICPNCGRELPDTARVCPSCNAVQRAYRRKRAEADVETQSAARACCPARDAINFHRCPAPKRTDESAKHRHSFNTESCADGIEQDKENAGTVGQLHAHRA